MKVKTFFNWLIVAVLCLAIKGCEKNDNDYKEQQSIIGCWSYPARANNESGKEILFYEKTDTLPADAGGINFLSDGTLIERKNAGWCGTPPIAYANFSGNWYIQNDSMIIDVAYWGGMEHKIWKILSVTNDVLKIEVISQEMG